MRAPRQRMTTTDAAEFFDFQPCGAASLGDPRPLCENLATGVVEVLQGVRDVQQLARFVTEQLYVDLLEVSIAARQRRGRAPGRRAVAAFEISALRTCMPDDGVVEASVVVRSSGRSRAIAMRLEGLDRRWRATRLSVL